MKACYAAFRRDGRGDQTWNGSSWVDYDGEGALTLMTGKEADALIPDGGWGDGYRYWLIDCDDSPTWVPSSSLGE